MPFPNSTPLPVRANIGFVLGLTGAVVMLAMDWVETLIAPSEMSDMLASAFAGAAVAGFLTAPLFGQPGKGGIGWACLGALLATSIGAGLGGLFFTLADVLADGRPEVITLSGLLSVFAISAGLVVSLIATTLVAPVWLIVMGAAHVVARVIRKAA